jgi:hypothetical protein
MSDTANTGEQVTQQAGANTGNEGNTAIPKARFDEVISERNQLRERLAALDAEAESRRKAELEAKGQFDTLRAEYEAKISQLEPKAKEYESYLTSRRETLLAGLRDDDKPLADGLPLDRLEKLVERLGKANTPPATPGTPGTAAKPTEYTAEMIRDGVTKEGLSFLSKVRSG